MGKANEKGPFKGLNARMDAFAHVSHLEPVEAYPPLLGRASLVPAKFVWKTPQLVLFWVDQVVRRIERSWKSPSFEGAKFTLERHPDEIPWTKEVVDWVFAKNETASSIYTALRELNNLLAIPYYRNSRYCASIDAAREALQVVCPADFPDLLFDGRFGDSDEGTAKILAKQFWGAAERFNSILDKIAEVVSASDYRSKVARENTRLKNRVNSVNALIDGLLHHNKSQAVVAVRLSIPQKKAADHVDEEIKKAFSRLITDRRNDALLNGATGYFWVMQESYGATFRQKLPDVDLNDPPSYIKVHYDLVMFFDARRSAEVVEIAHHIGALWKYFAGEGATYRRLNGMTFRSYRKAVKEWEVEKNGPLSSAYEFVGLVQEHSREAQNLRAAALTMVYSAALRRRLGVSPTLRKDKTRRFGKSDLQTGRGFTKPGRGNQRGPSEVTHERRKRPKYVAP
ncbi:hypothetical protein [Burkholderia sp. BE17]|uniref:hypothetical protein n=1 Tax=Burkholderia sp. BE17 TaxID=2656644 RepID=UPI00128CC253|nr:hypothetical protein [Burkholderia sp. BE17]MPV68015.1 hypothetical protein [Burkholderia sp. BE17]